MTQNTAHGYFTVGISALMQFFGALEALVPECRLHIANGTVSVSAVDSANVAMILATMKCECEGSAVLGVDVSAIHEPLRQIAKINGFDEEAPVKVSWMPGKEDPLIEIGIARPINYRERYTSLKESTIRKDPNRPTVTLNSEFICVGAKLFDAVNLCSYFSDVCRFDVPESGVVYLTAMGDIHQNRFELASGATAPALSRYSLDYLKDIAVVLKGSPGVKVALATDYPISLSAYLGPDVSVWYLLAPRIKDEEDPMEWMS